MRCGMHRDLEYATVPVAPKGWALRPSSNRHAVAIGGRRTMAKAQARLGGSPAGYSGKSTAQKLGYKPGTTVAIVGKPKDLGTELAVPGVKFSTKDGAVDSAHVFVNEKKALAAALPPLMKRIARDGMIWVSWPKKAAKIPTDVTEDVVREVALPLGLVDVKVCAIDDIWSGLKLVIRKERR